MKATFFMLILSSVIALNNVAIAGVSPGRESLEIERAKIQLYTSQLRCWQRGKLIFQEAGWVLDRKSEEKSTLVFTNAKKTGKSLYLTGSNNATCLYTK
ncbi:MAG: hypothetical protein OEZ58_22680 [Gammaproteobacteria bacterium]|nr:hypothetical protein [Gammaproteobacteria bacterium]